MIPTYRSPGHDRQSVHCSQAKDTGLPNQQFRPGFFSPSGHIANRATVRSPQALDCARYERIIPKGLGSLCQRKRAREKEYGPQWASRLVPLVRTIRGRRLNSAPFRWRWPVDNVPNNGGALTPCLNFATARVTFGHWSTLDRLQRFTPPTACVSAGHRRRDRPRRRTRGPGTASYGGGSGFELLVCLQDVCKPAPRNQIRVMF
jgi:hypothetical protein